MKVSYKFWVWGVIITIIVANLLRIWKGHPAALDDILSISILLLIAISLSAMVGSLKRIKDYLKGG